MNKDNEKRTTVTITTRQRKQLRALGHHLHPVVYVGKEGITKTVLKAIDDVITAHELIKVKIGQNCP
ncbi:MAG TPA: YhbY family RNA-binding protein, partial [Desulfobulbaceae bacterium]|nr:YhbY family RNA-binding protein [Desulfobulbaceae bacterium]